MRITRNSIEQAAKDQDTFRKGKQLYEGGMTELSQADSFWKNEVYVTARVRDGEMICQPRIFIRNGGVASCQCGCSETYKQGQLCSHGTAAVFAYLEMQEKEGHRRVITSPQTREILKGYADREKGKILAEENGGLLALIPHAVLQGSQIRVSFRIGKKGYPIRDLEAFAHSVRTGAYMAYGKNAGFYHDLEGFDPESRKLAEMVCGLTEESVSRDGAAGSGVRREGAVRSLLLHENHRDAFFALFAGKTLEMEERHDSRLVRVTEGEPALKLSVEGQGQEGIYVSLDRRFTMFSSDRRIYLLDRDCLYMCGADYSRDMGIFLKGMLSLPEAGPLAVGKRELPAFMAGVMPVLRQYCDIEEGRGASGLSRLEPEPLQAYFYIDCPSGDVVTLSVTYRYGDVSFSPLQEPAPFLDYRDEVRELRISHILKKYFTARYVKSSQLVIDGDEEGIYRLMEEGIGELEQEGIVELSRKARELEAWQMPPVQINLTLKGGWLSLDVDLEGLPPEDLKEILSRYEEKRAYYRMKDGSFLKINEKEADTLLALSHCGEGGQGISRVPAGRLWYINWLLEQSQETKRQQDSGVDRLLQGLEALVTGEGTGLEEEVPDTLKGILRPYQVKGFCWLASLDRLGFGGILADDMGLGKTIQVLALLVREQQIQPGRCSPSLVVCPSSLVFNWEQECRRFAPSLRVLAVTGTGPARQQLLEHVREYDLVLTSYDMLKRDIAMYEPIIFRYHIIDEAQYIKNQRTKCAAAVKAVRSRTRFALTGTPVENRLEELWSIFDFLMPGYLYTSSRFRQMFETPLIRDGDQEALARLLCLTRPFILRRVKGDVLQELPEKVENVVYAKIEGEQKKLYTAAAVRLKEMLEEESDGEFRQNRLMVLTRLTRLRQICCDPGLCYENYQGESAKMEACMELVENGAAGGHKILVFSQFASMLRRIAARLDQAGISYHLLTGSTGQQERKQMVSSFGEDSVRVFLISLKAGGVGLNLTAADIVIHYDPWWNAAAQNQATDRAHRIGQKHTVMVYQLIARNTIEENILKLQEAKGRLASQVVDGDPRNFAALSREDLIRLLEGM